MTAPARSSFPIDVDYRQGSGEYLDPLRRMGLPVRKRTLAYADFAFLGNGPHGTARIGIERKTVSEIVGCLGGDTRFARRQLPGLLTSYDYAWLVVEGPARVDRSGLLMNGGSSAGWGRQRFMYSTFKRYLTTMAVKGRVFVEPTYGFTETLWLIEALYGWWQATWASHQSAYEVDETEPDHAILTERTVKRKIANQLPGISWTRSYGVSQAFDTPEDMITATEAEWRAALGIAKGRKLAAQLNQVCRRKDKWG